MREKEGGREREEMRVHRATRIEAGLPLQREGRKVPAGVLKEEGEREKKKEREENRSQGRERPDEVGWGKGDYSGEHDRRRKQRRVTKRWARAREMPVRAGREIERERERRRKRTETRQQRVRPLSRLHTTSSIPSLHTQLQLHRRRGSLVCTCETARASLA